MQSVVGAKLREMAASRHGVNVSSVSCHCQQSQNDVSRASQSTRAAVSHSSTAQLTCGSTQRPTSHSNTAAPVSHVCAGIETENGSCDLDHVPFRGDLSSLGSDVIHSTYIPMCQI